VVADEDGVVATATAVVRGDDALLRSVAVDEERRGGGLGILVVVAAAHHARGRGAKRVWLLTETAEPFFARLGFERAERRAMPGWADDEGMAECSEGAVAMRRELGQPSQPGR
jgi:amino-acid N-acetyltransferase